MDVRRGGQEILLNGMALVLAGLIWGLIVPHTPYPRLALGAHIQFEANGLLLIVMAVLLLKFDHDVGPRSILVMRLSVWLTWAMALSEVAPVGGAQQTFFQSWPTRRELQVACLGRRMQSPRHMLALVFALSWLGRS